MPNDLRSELNEVRKRCGPLLPSMEQSPQHTYATVPINRFTPRRTHTLTQPQLIKEREGLEAEAEAIRSFVSPHIYQTLKPSPNPNP